MPETQITFIKGDSVGPETDYRDNLPVNMTAIDRPILGADGYMLQAPGLVSISEFPEDDPCKGAIWNERLETQFRVWGTPTAGVFREAIYTEVPNVGLVLDFALRGFWSGDTLRPVSLPYSFNTQGVVAANNFFLWDGVTFKTGGVDIDPLFVGTIDAVWIDGYYFLTDGESIYHTSLLDEEIVEFSESTAQLSPDPILGLGLTQDNKVIVFGRYTIEYFQNVGSSGFAFQRLPNRAVKSGIVATHAKVEIMGSWFYVGGRKEEGLGVHALSGVSPQRVSTREIEKILGTYSETDLINMNIEGREEDSIHYLIIHLPDQTLQLNVSLSQKVGVDGAWSILKSGVDSDIWRANFGLFDSTYGGWVYGDDIDGRVGLLDSTVATQYNEIAEWYLYTPFIYLESASIDSLEVEIIPGHTVTDDATVFVSITQDGVTEGSEYINEYGMQFDYSNRFISRRHGYVRDWFSIRLRGASKSRMAFGKSKIKYE
jgi:hypothetical protein